MIDPQKIIVALDVETLVEAKRFVKLLKKEVRIFKVGSILFTVAGPGVIEMIHRAGGQVFLDLKYHDIPNTVAKACQAAARLGVFMVDVHASGGQSMLERAVSAIREESSSTRLIGVTVLTSQDPAQEVTPEVMRLARLCQNSGLDGIVCSPHEIENVRKTTRKDFLIVTPGIRIASRSDDQKRIATPAIAFQRGADYIVVGRPILEAEDPVRAFQSLLQSP